MPELSSISSNLLAIYDENGHLIPQAEVILIMTEPTYSIDAGGVVKQREVLTARFAASPAILRQVAKNLLRIADECVEALETATAPKEGK